MLALATAQLSCACGREAHVAETPMATMAGPDGGGAHECPAKDADRCQARADAILPALDAMAAPPIESAVLVSIPPSPARPIAASVRRPEAPPRGPPRAPSPIDRFDRSLT